MMELHSSNTHATGHIINTTCTILAAVFTCVTHFAYAVPFIKLTYFIYATHFCTTLTFMYVYSSDEYY